MKQLSPAAVLLLVLAGMTACQPMVQPAETRVNEPVRNASTTAEGSEAFQCICIETMPEFPGGQLDLVAFLTRNLRFPQAAKAKKISGTVFVSFLIDQSGAVKQVEAVKGIGFGCNEEAVRVVRMMPNWKPGEQNGLPVSVRYMLPIRFLNQ